MLKHWVVSWVLGTADMIGRDAPDHLLLQHPTGLNCTEQMFRIEREHLLQGFQLLGLFFFL